MPRLVGRIGHQSKAGSTSCDRELLFGHPVAPLSQKVAKIVSQAIFLSPFRCILGYRCVASSSLCCSIQCACLQHRPQQLAVGNVTNAAGQRVGELALNPLRPLHPVLPSRRRSRDYREAVRKSFRWPVRCFNHVQRR